MECAVKKYQITEGQGTPSTLNIFLYGFREDYFPLAHCTAFDKIIKDFSHIFKDSPNLVIYYHDNQGCHYTHPETAWVECQFERDFNNHGLDLCRRASQDSDNLTLILPFNSVWAGLSPKVFVEKEITYESSYRTMYILSETYLKVNGIKKHISELDTDECSQLYSNLSAAYDSYITSWCDFKSNKLNGLNRDSKIFVIPSILEVEDRTKNIYSHDERFRQTLDQVKSIHGKVTNAVIILTELSCMSLRQIFQISKYVSALIFFNHDPKARECARDRNKNKAEVYLQESILEKLDGTEFSHFCKFGGRYSLADKFEEKNFFSDKPTFRIIPRAHDGATIIESILYSVPFSLCKTFGEVLGRMQEIMERNFTDVEHLIYSLFCRDREVNYIPVLGIAGHFAGSGAYNPS